MAMVLVAIAFEAALIALSFWADVRFRQEATLPMQWWLDSSKPLPAKVTWSAPRRLALSFLPALSLLVLILFVAASLTLKSRAGQEGMVLPSLFILGGVLVAIHAFHIWMVGRTLDQRPG